MSWQEGEGYDPADEVDGRTQSPTAENDYLSAAADWLVKAEEERDKLADAVLQEGGPEYIPRGGGYVLLYESAARLAELNIRMATACGAYQDRQPRVEMKTGWLTDAVGDTMARVSETLKADVEAHQAETLRPGIDPEPPEDGALWTDDGEYFAFAVFPLEREIQRWLIIKSYTQALKWHNDYPNNFITADTWEGLDGKIGYADDAPLRRPTAAERVAFYGPEPDPTAAIMETHERTTEPEPEEMYSEGAARALERCSKSAEASGKTRTAQWLYACAAASRRGIVDWPPAPAYKGTVVHLDDLEPDLQSLGGEALRKLYESVKRERTRRWYTSPGGAAQWREG